MDAIPTDDPSKLGTLTGDDLICRFAFGDLHTFDQSVHLQSKLLLTGKLCTIAWLPFVLLTVLPIRGLAFTDQHHRICHGTECEQHSRSYFQTQVGNPEFQSQTSNSNPGDLLVLAAGQCRQMGRTLSVCPDALLDDGLLDFTIVMGSLKDRVGAFGRGWVGHSSGWGLVGLSS